MMEDRLPRVLLTYRTTITHPVMIPSVRLCGHLQMQALADAGRIEYMESNVDGLAKMDLSWPDIVLLGRLDTRAEYHLAQKLKAAGKYLIYILDDDLLNVPENISSASHYCTREVKNNIRKTIELCDAILSPSPLLLEKYAHAHTRCMLTEEPAVLPHPYMPRESDSPVTIGFAGSIDRISDVERVLQQALERIHQEYGERVKFSFFGAIPSFAQKLNAEVIPYQNGYEAYRCMLNAAKWDIGLAPMMDSPFHRYKHYNKFCEYAASGIVGIFSRHEPYLRLERNIGIGLFCSNTVDAWYSAIKSLLDDEQRLEALRMEVCTYAHGPLAIEQIAGKLYEEHGEVFAYRAPQLDRALRMPLFRVEQIASRLYILWQWHGWRTPVHIVKRIIGRVIGKVKK